MIRDYKINNKQCLLNVVVRYANSLNFMPLLQGNDEYYAPFSVHYVFFYLSEFFILRINNYITLRNTWILGLNVFSLLRKCCTKNGIVVVFLLFFWITKNQRTMDAAGTMNAGALYPGVPLEYGLCIGWEIAMTWTGDRGTGFSAKRKQ